MTTTLVTDYAGESSQYIGNTRNHTRKHTLTSDVVLTRPEIFLVTGVPHRWDPWGPDDLGALCTSVDVDDDSDNELVYRLTANYTSDFGGNNDPTQQDDNPLLRPTKWRYTSVRNHRTHHKDRRGNAYKNSAGQPFRSPPQVNYSTSRYTVVRAEATFNATLADNYASVVNTVAWYGKAPGTVLMESISAEEMWDGDASAVINYWLVTYVLHVDRNGWQPVEVVSKGTFYYDGGFGAAGTKKHTPNGEEVFLTVSDPKVATDGDKIPDADVEAGNIDYVKFWPYDEKDITIFAL